MLTDDELNKMDAGKAEAIARILELFTAAVLEQRIEQAQQGRKLAQARQEGRGLADAADDWLRGEGNQ